MNFKVIWTTKALNQLSEIWTHSEDRSAVTQASFEIDQMLIRNPLEFGESREGIQRIGFKPPLSILFDVDDMTGLVYVLSVGAMFRPI